MPRNETSQECAGYIEDRYNHSADTGPFEISCANQTFVKWGPPEHQTSACCTDRGRLVVQQALVGGFDIVYKGNTTSFESVDTRCVAYTEALRATICDPLQGQHVLRTPENETIFRICQSSCDAVFSECGLPGVNYPRDVVYTDGMSMCRAAWGGWGKTPCEKNKEQFPCTVTALEIVNDTIDAPSAPCLSIIYPTDETLEIYKDTGEPPDACYPAEPSSLGIFIAVVVTVLVALSVCGFLIYIHARHRQAEEDFG